MNEEENQLSQLFIEACKRIENFALGETGQETKQKNLYYHTINHVYGVKRRANLIFQALKPILVSKIETKELDRIEHLISICALAHDMIQEFSFSLKKSYPRERPFGLSETATTNKLINYISNINRDLSAANSQTITIFTKTDINIIDEAIQATVCQYDYLNNFIYQPYLYQQNKQLNLAAKILALADLGTLGMEGIKPFIEEGILLFLEENLDIAELFLEQKNNQVPQNTILTKLKKSGLYPNLKERLLKYTRYLVKFAQARKTNFEREIASFDREAKEILREGVFTYLTDETIQQIESLVPTANHTTLTELLIFFNFEQYVRSF